MVVPWYCVWRQLQQCLFVSVVLVVLLVAFLLGICYNKAQGTPKLRHVRWGAMGELFDVVWTVV